MAYKFLNQANIDQFYLVFQLLKDNPKYYLLRTDKSQMVTNHVNIGSPPRASNHEPFGSELTR